MEDKRVTKTKGILKQTLIQLLEDKPFEQITVKELCDQAYVSRITFYTHYKDKYALVDEIFEDMVALGLEEYRRLQAANNTAADPISSYLNLLDAILTVYFEQNRFFRHTAPERNPYLAAAFFNQLFQAVETRTKHTETSFHVRYSARKITAFLCFGLFGFVNEGLVERNSLERIRRESREVLSGILKSGVLLTED